MEQSISSPRFSRPYLAVVPKSDDVGTADARVRDTIPNGSFAMIPAEVFALQDGNAIAVYAVLAQHADRKTGECWPSMKRLEACLGWSDSRIRPPLQRLIDAGLVEKEARKLRGMDQSNRYRLVKKPANVQVYRDEGAVPRGEAMGIPSQDTRYPATGHEPESGELESKELEDVNPLPPTGSVGANDDHEPSKPEPKPTPVDADFETFWKTYPRKQAKGAALKAWKRLRPNAELRQIILDAVAAQKQSPGWLEQGGRFIPHPATWLNAGRWQDELDEPPPSPPTNGAAPPLPFAIRQAIAAWEASYRDLGKPVPTEYPASIRAKIAAAEAGR